MGFQLPPLSEAFAKAAWSRIDTEIVASPYVKARLRKEVLRLHSKSAVSWEVMKSLSAVVYQRSWAWPRGESLLIEQLGRTPNEEEKLEMLFHWFSRSTHGLFRRGQIRSLLKTGRYESILVHLANDGEKAAPCGLQDGDVLPVTPDVLKRIPPCNHPFCECQWTLDF